MQDLNTVKDVRHGQNQLIDMEVNNNGTWKKPNTRKTGKYGCHKPTNTQENTQSGSKSQVKAARKEGIS